MRKCIYCGKELKGRRIKYCDDLCNFRYLSIKNDVPSKRRIAQSLRMSRAGRSQRAGRVGCRYN